MPGADAHALHIRIARLFFVLDHGWQNVLHALQTAGWAAIGAIHSFTPCRPGFVVWPGGSCYGPTRMSAGSCSSGCAGFETARTASSR